MPNPRINKQGHLNLNESINRMGQQKQEKLQEAWWDFWNWNWLWGDLEPIKGMPGFYGSEGHGPPYYIYDKNGDWVEVDENGDPVPNNPPTLGDPTGEGMDELDDYNRRFPTIH